MGLWGILFYDGGKLAGGPFCDLFLARCEDLHSYLSVFKCDFSIFPVNVRVFLLQPGKSQDEIFFADVRNPGFDLPGFYSHAYGDSNFVSDSSRFVRYVIDIIDWDGLSKSLRF